MEETAMKKIAYEKPAMCVVELQHNQMLASSDPTRNVPWWDGEGGVKDQGEIYDDPFNVWDDDWSLE